MIILYARKPLSMAFLPSQKPIMVVGSSTMALSISDTKKAGSAGSGCGNGSGTDKKHPSFRWNKESGCGSFEESWAFAQTIGGSKALGTDG